MKLTKDWITALVFIKILINGLTIISFLEEHVLAQSITPHFVSVLEWLGISNLTQMFFRTEQNNVAESFMKKK